MTALPRAADFPLPPVGVELLEARLRADEERIKTTLASLRLTDPVCALALVYVWQDDLPTASYASVLLEATRTAAFATGDDGDALWTLWSPADWDRWDFLDQPEDEEFESVEELASFLRDAGAEDPEGAFVCELAHRLARTDWTGAMEVTDDFACWATEHEIADAVDTFRVTASPAAVEAYAARRWLRLPGHPA